MTLTQAAVLTKQLVFSTIFLIIAGIGSFTGYQIWYEYYLSTIPPVEEKPDTKFGILPQADFPLSNVSSSNFTYSLDTITGNLPKVGEEGFPKIIKVYFITKPYASLLSSEKSQELAAKFGINAQPQILTDTQYKFKEDEKTLDVDLDSGNFTYKNEASISAAENLDNENKLVTDFQSILKSTNIFKEDLTKGRTKVVLLKQTSKDLVPTQLRTESIGAQISLWPQEIDRKHIFTPEFDKSLISAIIINSSNDLENYKLLDFTYWPVDINIFATYPTKSPADAFSDLQSGKATIIIEPGKPQVSITSIYLGYYLSKSYSPYLQPIYIFEGPQFISYVSAVDKAFMEE